jgi:hypothetical protein
MYQIFYIDIDEEITSVIDRLKKSKTTENFFVVSPRSLILQSIVSLKLLKREAAREKKQIAMVVNDKDAGAKIEKAGILVVPSLKGFEGGEEEVRENFSSTMEIKDTKNNNKYKNFMEQGKNDKKNRLQGIGSDDFYKSGEVEKTDIANSEQNSENKQSLEDARPKAETFGEQPVQGMDMAFRKNTADVKKDKPAFSYAPEKNFEEGLSSQKTEVPKEYGPNKIENMDPYKEKLVEGFFNPAVKSQELPKKKIEPQKKDQLDIPVSHGMRKVIVGFIVVCLLIASLVSSWLF